jgi:RHS repeat-associated protein
LKQSSNGVVNKSSYNAANNELTNSTYLSSRYSYYPDGRLKTWNFTSLSSQVTYAYNWDLPGNLVKVATNSGTVGGTLGSYSYDGLRRRVEATEGSSIVFYAYQDTETLAEQVPSGVATDYLYGAGMRIAKAGTYIATNYYHTDALGSTRLVTGPNGKIVFSDNYQPFGQDNGTTGSETNRFTGKPYSQATGLYYEYERWYDPATGRFISEDPLAGLCLTLRA